MPSETKVRIVSIDAFRGFVMLLMLNGALGWSDIAKKFPENRALQLIGFHTDHVAWRGCSLHDMIQPAFSFLVGVAVPFSLASRIAAGKSNLSLIGHAMFRALILIGLGIFLRSDGNKMTNFQFMDTLTQIGLGYVFLFLLGYRTAAWHWSAFGVLLGVSFAIFAFHPVPADFDYAAVGVPREWEHHATGFAAHWNKNSNAGWAFDQWFLNLFYRPEPFKFNPGGYVTLNFIPTLATMILGLIAGNWLKEGLPKGALFLRLLIAGTLLFSAGYALDLLGIIPNVKRIWTPSWTLFSGGLCMFMMLGFTLVFDGTPLRYLAFPLVVIGANSIFIYCASGMIRNWIARTLSTHLHIIEQHFNFETYKIFGPEFESAVRGGLVILVFWLILLWMYCRKIFIKV